MRVFPASRKQIRSSLFLTIRFQPHICELFDFGVVDNSYWIVMKYYPTTLKKWRDELPGSVGENLAVLLGVFAQVRGPARPATQFLEAVVCPDGI